MSLTGGICIGREHMMVIRDLYWHVLMYTEYFISLQSFARESGVFH